MTETEWLTSTDLEDMLSFVHARASDRQLRLFACACLRRFEFLLRDEEGRKGIGVAEKYADGLVARGELREAHHSVPYFLSCVTAHEAVRSAVFWVTTEDASLAASRVAASLRSAAVATILSQTTAQPSLNAQANLAAFEARHAEETHQAFLLRDIVGTHLEPRPALDPTILSWNNSLIRRMAEAIYAERCWLEMAILADALLDAGCPDENLIQHCRDAGEHVRGCWALDHILGKNSQPTPLARLLLQRYASHLPAS